MRHDEAQMLLAAGSVLDDLAPDERASYETHRATCGQCPEVELDLEYVLADLSLVVPERMPPPELLTGIRRALAEEAAVPFTGPGATLPARTGATDVTSRPHVVSLVPRRPRRLPAAASLALAAALGIVAVGLGVRTAALQQDLDSAAAQVASLEAALAQRADAVTVAMNPSHLTVALHGDVLAPDAEAAVVFVPGQSAAYLVARNLPATPTGHGYQLWYADADGVHPLQTVAYDGSGPFVAPIGVDLADSTAVMITLEASGGARGEPGPQVVFGEL